MKNKEVKIDFKVLIPIWQQSDSLDQVLGKLRLTASEKPLLGQKAAYLRSKGVKLKPMPRGNMNRVDWGSLKKLAEKSLPADESIKEVNTN